MGASLGGGKMPGSAAFVTGRLVNWSVGPVGCPESSSVPTYVSSSAAFTMGDGRELAKCPGPQTRSLSRLSLAKESVELRGWNTEV